ncbi:hypothetical protein [Flavobacterium phage V186]|nr:hypothetical protein [Flavobacterium phage FCOV-S1]QCW21850.1 hypothetical protein [Flavobacterium phage FCOV-S2]QCW21924.1 hypothetical protein [Flavobacterium phage V186]QNJ53924.1 hypothetical protein [Flavobacterium phage FCOV-F56]QNJ54150.1 hypothetical protein [Flavobacterium phage V186]
MEKTKKQIEIDKLISLESNTEILKSNSKDEVTKARKVLKTCLELEKEKLAKGYEWLTNGKTSKLVHPDKISLELSNGFKVSKKKFIFLI